MGQVEQDAVFPASPVTMREVSQASWARDGMQMQADYYYSAIE